MGGSSLWCTLSAIGPSSSQSPRPYPHPPFIGCSRAGCYGFFVGLFVCLFGWIFLTLFAVTLETLYIVFTFKILFVAVVVVFLYKILLTHISHVEVHVSVWVILLGKNERNAYNPQMSTFRPNRLLVNILLNKAVSAFYVDVMRCNATRCGASLHGAIGFRSSSSRWSGHCD